MVNKPKRSGAEGTHDLGAFLRELAQMLVDEGSPAVAIDPDAKNERARRAYARAGFEGDEIVKAAEGSVVVMVFRYHG